MSVAPHLLADGPRRGRFLLALTVMAMLGVASATMLAVEVPSLFAAYGDDS